MLICFIFPSLYVTDSLQPAFLFNLPVGGKHSTSACKLVPKNFCRLVRRFHRYILKFSRATSHLSQSQHTSTCAVRLLCTLDQSTQCLEHKHWHVTWRIQTSSSPQRFRNQRKTLAFASTWPDGKLRQHLSNYTINYPLVTLRTRLQVNPASRMTAAVFTHDSLSLTLSKSCSTTVWVGLSWL